MLLRSALEDSQAYGESGMGAKRKGSPLSLSLQATTFLQKRTVRHENDAFSSTHHCVCV